MRLNWRIRIDWKLVQEDYDANMRLCDIVKKHKTTSKTLARGHREDLWDKHARRLPRTMSSEAKRNISNAIKKRCMALGVKCPPAGYFNVEKGRRDEWLSNKGIKKPSK